jgi:peptide/nickel transport system substrate-binding protein
MTAASGLTLILTLAACASSSASGSAGAGKPVSGGTLTYLVDEGQPALDPAVSPSSATALIDRGIFDSLVVQTGPSTFKPWLATSWTISPDGLEYTFHLRTGVKFSDGTPFNAAAVKATLDHVVNPATKSVGAAALIAPYKSSTVTNDSTIKVTLSRPFRPLLQGLSQTSLGIQSPKELALPATQYKPVGTGPFTFVSWLQQKNVDLRRNPDYNSPPANADHTGPAYLENLNFDLVTEDATRYGALTSGQAQGIADVPPIDIKTLKAMPGFKVLTAASPGENYNLYFNTTNGPTSDLRVRQALQAATNIPALVKSVYFGQFTPAVNALSPTTADYDAAASKALRTNDTAKAKQLLDEAGWTDTDSAGYRTRNGQELDVVWPYFSQTNREQRNVLGEGVQAEAKQVGINIVRPNVDAGTYVSDLVGGKYNILDFANERADPDVLWEFFDSAETPAHGGGNVAKISSPQLDGWLNDAQATSDPTVAKTDYANVQADVLRNAYVLPGYVTQYTLGASRRLQGITFDQQASPLFYGAWLSE